VVLLKQECPIECSGDPASVDGIRELEEALETDDAGTAPADVRLDDEGEVELPRRAKQQGWIVHHARARNREPQPFQKRDLQGLARLEPEDARAVEDGHAPALQMREIVARIEDRFAQPPLPGRRAHPVEDERKIFFGLRRIEPVARGVDPYVRDLPPRKLGEERLEPVRVLVENRDRS